AADLEKEMKNIGRNTKALSKTIGDPAKKTEALAEIGQMIKSAETAKTLTPKKAAEIPDAQRAQFISDYQKQIEGLIEQFKKIEADLTADKSDDAKAEFAKIGMIKRDGHEKFAAKE
ncbi:MAG: cytochrome b562, partial [Verrucomicrobiota bacterium]